jgi:hypothetical protein
MIGLSVAAVRRSILDQRLVVDKVAQATNRALAKFGAYTRQTAKTMLRPRKGVSEPGQPPSSHTGLLRNNILFVVEPSRRNVVIGPMLLNRVSPTALSALEHGGPTIILRRVRNKEPEAETVNMPARPFMRPAFEREIDRAPYLWANGLR